MRGTVHRTVIVEMNLIALCEFYVNNEIREYIAYLEHANVEHKSLSTASVARENLPSFVLSFAQNPRRTNSTVFPPFRILQNSENNLRSRVWYGIRHKQREAKKLSVKGK